jgi:SAM-dependent methyltransferase
MNLHDSDSVFAGSVPELYDDLLVPLIFEPYADDLVSRLSEFAPDSVLEVAAGSGVASRAMSAGLDPSTTIVCSDLNQPMIDHAKAIGTANQVEWRQADVMDLPFEAESFEAVVCQFGVMFFPDWAEAFSEIARVLRPGGMFLFNVWDCIAENEFADVVTQAVATLFPDDPPRFLDRTPHGYYEESIINGHLAAAGFDVPADFDAVVERSVASSSEIPAIAYCQGTPLRNEIEERDPGRLLEATAAASRAIADRFGTGSIDGKISGFVVSARCPPVFPPQTEET